MDRQGYSGGIHWRRVGGSGTPPQHGGQEGRQGPDGQGAGPAEAAAEGRGAGGGEGRAAHDAAAVQSHDHADTGGENALDESGKQGLDQSDAQAAQGGTKNQAAAIVPDQARPAGQGDDYNAEGDPPEFPQLPLQGTGQQGADAHRQDRQSGKQAGAAVPKAGGGLDIV